MPIFDQGYQHWQGTLSGHAWRWLAITRQGVRGQLKSKYLRMVLLFAWVPALGLAGVLSVWGLMEQKAEVVRPWLQGMGDTGRQIMADPTSFRHMVWGLAFFYFFQIEMYFAMILIVLCGPNLISQDLRFNAFPLYFARPLRRFDYFAGKLGVIAFFLAAVVILPAILAYVLGVCFSLDLSIIVDMFPLLLTSIAFGVVVVVSAGLLMLAVSSLSRNSRYVAAFWIGVWFVTSAVAGVVGSIRFEMARHEARAEAFQPGMQPQQWGRARQQLLADFIRTDWSSLLSYTANLQRVGRALMNTDAAWNKLGNVVPGGDRAGVAMMIGPQYPWYWSAFVLAGLAGLSVWILSARVKSLDRLR